MKRTPSLVNFTRFYLADGPPLPGIQGYPPFVSISGQMQLELLFTLFATFWAFDCGLLVTCAPPTYDFRSSSSNQLVSVKLVPASPQGPQSCHTFQPTFRSSTRSLVNNMRLRLCITVHSPSHAGVCVRGRIAQRCHVNTIFARY